MDIGQICVLGAGLDCRPWRLSNDGCNAPSSKLKYFEVDFPEIFSHKLPILASMDAQTQFEYISVCADLSLPNWLDALISAGFDPTKPTLWLLEGLTMYLTESEISAFFCWYYRDFRR